MRQSGTAVGQQTQGNENDDTHGVFQWMLYLKTDLPWYGSFSSGGLLPASTKSEGEKKLTIIAIFMFVYDI